MLLGTFALANPGIEETILRSVGNIAILTDSAGGAEQQIGAFAMGLFNSIAIAAGVASLPDPVTDVGDDSWFVFQGINQSNLVNTAVGVLEANLYAFDSKAKRILADGFAIALIVANGHATHGFTINFNVRILSMVRGT